MQLSTYNPEQSQQIIQLFIDVFSDSEGEQEGQVIGSLVADLIATTDKNDLQGYVGSLGGKTVAAIFFSRITLASEKSAFILSPVAVASQQQGNGLGQQLINFGIQQLKSQDIELLFTYGDPAFYSKVGFAPVSEEVIRAPQKLSYPHGWLAQSLDGEAIAPEAAAAQCVAALNKPHYW